MSSKAIERDPIDLLNRWFSYDAVTGVVAWKVKPCRNIRIGRPAGCRWENGRNTYIRISVEGRWIFAHAIAFAAIHGRVPVGVIDHINGNGSDNRAVNLRDVSHTDNLRNQRRNARNTSGAMGVDFHAGSKKWRARIIVDRKERHLGTFDTQSDALSARKAAEVKFGFHQNHGRA